MADEGGELEALVQQGVGLGLQFPSIITGSRDPQPPKRRIPTQLTKYDRCRTLILRAGVPKTFLLSTRSLEIGMFAWDFCQSHTELIVNIPTQMALRVSGSVRRAPKGNGTQGLGFRAHPISSPFLLPCSYPLEAQKIQVLKPKQRAA